MDVLEVYRRARTGPVMSEDAFDLETGQPGQEYVDLYGEVKDELRAMGFPYRS